MFCKYISQVVFCSMNICLFLLFKARCGKNGRKTSANQTFGMRFVYVH